MAKPQGLLSPLERQTYESFGIAPREDRLSLLPRYNAQTGLVAPQFVYDAAKALAAPYTAAQGYDLPPEEAINVGMNMMGGGAVGTAPKGALRTFIGRDAKTWDKAAARQFLKLEKSGVSPEDAWKQTGVFRGLDNDLRQEISDKPAFLKGSGSYGDVVMNRLSALENAGLRQSGDPVNVSSIYYHPELFRAYPSLAKTEAEFMPKGQTATGQMGGNILRMQYDLPNKPAKSVMLHELQHGVQSFEGFSPGANTKDIKLSDIPAVYIKRAEKLMNKAQKLTDQDKLQEANNVMSERNRVLEQGRYAAYKRNAGEVEARLTQRRMDLTDAERRANFPLNRGLLGIDVNPNKINF
jgi:hypothetical protein